MYMYSRVSSCGVGTSFNFCIIIPAYAHSQFEHVSSAYKNEQNPSIPVVQFYLENQVPFTFQLIYVFYSIRETIILLPECLFSLYTQT